MTLQRISLPGKRPLPARQSPDNRAFWDALAGNEFRTTRCSHCQRLSFPPRSLCPSCYQQDMQWVTLSGRGRLYSCTTSHMAPPAFQALLPLHIGVVDLEEGLRLLVNLVGTDTVPPLDSPVVLVVTEFDDALFFAATPQAED